MLCATWIRYSDDGMRHAETCNFFENYMDLYQILNKKSLEPLQKFVVCQGKKFEFFYLLKTFFN